MLLDSWEANLWSRRFLFDVVVNIGVYIPLGGVAYLAMRRLKSRVLAVVLSIAIGALLSATLEMVQLFTPRRVCSAVDLFSNTLGSTVGVLAGFAFTQVAKRPVDGIGFRFRDRRAIALLFCWVAFLLFPLFPELWLVGWRAKLSAFVHPSAISPIPILLSIAEWFAVGRLLVAAGVESPTRWLWTVVLLVPVQFGIINHRPQAADIAGAVLGALVFRFFGMRPSADRLAGIALLLTLTLRGLAPYQLEGSQAFVWIPFGGLLGSEWQNTISILLGKLFRYGSSIWLLHRAGLDTMRATAIVFVVLAGIEMFQVWLPGHVAEITDPLLALLLLLAFRTLGRSYDSESSDMPGY